MAGLVIDWLALEAAFESHDPHHRTWLDASTGALHTADAPGGSTWLRVEPIPSREQYRIMERFIATVDNAALKEALQDAIVGKGAFRRFKDAVGRFPEERKRWFAFRDALLHRFILDWIKSHHLELQEIPAWNVDPPMTPAAEVHEIQEPHIASSERGDVDHLRSYVQAWARAHGEEYRYLFGPVAFERLANDLSHEFILTRKPRSSS